MAKAVAGKHGLREECKVGLALDLARGRNVQAREEGGVAAKEVIGGSVFLDNNDDVLNLALGAGGTLRVGDGS